MSNYSWNQTKLSTSLIQLRGLSIYLGAMSAVAGDDAFTTNISALVRAAMLVAELGINPTLVGDPSPQIAKLMANAFKETKLKVFLREEVIKPAKTPVPIVVPTFKDLDVVRLLPVPPCEPSRLTVSVLCDTLCRFREVFTHVAQSSAHQHVKPAAYSIEMLLTVACKITTDAKKGVKTEDLPWLARHASDGLSRFNIQVKVG